MHKFIISLHGCLNEWMMNEWMNEWHNDIKVTDKHIGIVVTNQPTKGCYWITKRTYKFAWMENAHIGSCLYSLPLVHTKKKSYQKMQIDHKQC